MLLGLITTLFFFICILLLLIILIQKGKGGMGIGSMGGMNTMLFGGSGGQDVFQKITWVLGTIFMAGSLVLSIAKTQQTKGSQYFEQFKSKRSSQTDNVKNTNQRRR